MGYNFTARFSVTTTDSATITMGLDLDNLSARMAANNNPGDFNASDHPDLIERLLGMLGFDIQTTTSDQAWDQHGTPIDVITYLGTAATILTTTVDTVLVWMAEHGAEIHLECQGEDGIGWRYTSELNGRDLTYELLGSTTAPSTPTQQGR